MAVAQRYNLPVSALCAGGRPRGELSTARNLSMWLCQVRGRMTLSEIAKAFHLGHYTSVSTAIGTVKRRVQQDVTLREQCADIHASLDIISSNP